MRDNTIDISELFTPQQLADLRVLLLIENYTERITALKAYLIPLRVELEAQGVVPEYLAYALESMRSKKS